MKAIILFFLLLLSLHQVGHCQTESDSLHYNRRFGADLKQYISLLSEYNFWRHHYAEIGVAFNQYERAGLHPSAYAYFVSSEIKIDNKLVIGPKVGVG